jgi:anaerobic selenocysteine-containing dehydrogenase
MNSTLADLGRGPEDGAVWVHPIDALGAAVGDGDHITLTSATGWMDGIVRVTDDIPVGAVSIPHGLSTQNVNRLTSGAPGRIDPLSAMITQSGIPVTLRPTDRSIAVVAVP